MDSWSFLVIAFWESLCSWSDTMMRVMLNSQDVSRRMTLQLKAVVTLPLLFLSFLPRVALRELRAVAERKDSAVTALEKTGVWPPAPMVDGSQPPPSESPDTSDLCGHQHSHAHTYLHTDKHTFAWFEFKKKRVSFSGNVFFLVVFLKNLILAHLRRFGTVKEVLDVWAVSVNLASVNSTWILTGFGELGELSQALSSTLAVLCLLLPTLLMPLTIYSCVICALGRSIANCRFLSKWLLMLRQNNLCSSAVADFCSAILGYRADENF